MLLTEEALQKPKITGLRQFAYSCSLAVFTVLAITLNSTMASAAAVSPIRCQSELTPGAPHCAAQDSVGSTRDSTLDERYVGNPMDVVTGNKYQRELAPIIEFLNTLITRHWQGS